jgi:hypothetical protein
VNTARASAIKVTIAGWYENYPPGIVECSLTDRFGKNWRFAIKYYDATENELRPESEYPLPSLLSCDVLSRGMDKDGREIATIELAIPLENLTQRSVDCFEVFAEQLV